MSCEKKLRYANTQSYSSVIPRMRVQIFVFVIFIKALFRNWDSRLQHLCRRIEASIFYCQVLCLHNSSFLLPFGYNIMPYNLELYISLLHLFPQKYVLFITYQQELYFESWLSVGRMESYCGLRIKRTSTSGSGLRLPRLRVLRRQAESKSLRVSEWRTLIPGLTINQIFLVLSFIAVRWWDFFLLEFYQGILQEIQMQLLWEWIFVSSKFSNNSFWSSWISKFREKQWQYVATVISVIM